MSILTFKGGIHPYDGKEHARQQAIRKLLPGRELAFLLSQHIGAPAKPVVSVGDRVLKGQVLAEAGGYVSAPVHSSVSGTVKRLAKVKNASGDLVDALIVENDSLYEEVSFEKAGLDELSAEEILGRIRAAGIVGMGGAGFPTHVKLAPKEPDKIGYVLVNGCECEPYLTSDYRRMVENPDWLVEGLRCILRLFDNAEGVICIEDNKPDAAEILEKLVADEPRMRVAVVKTKYPEGAERCLIKAVTGRELNSRLLPADLGCVVNNVDTVIAIYKAVIFGEPLISRILTLSGDAPANPCNYEVPVGMYYRDIVEAAGGFKAEPEKLISGGPMMGFALYDLEVPVTKTSGAITCFLKDQVSAEKETPCINCGRCLRACPERLMPGKLADFSERGQKDRFKDYYGLECVECGSCSYVCPARRPLAANIKSMRRTVMADMKKK